MEYLQKGEIMSAITSGISFSEKIAYLRTHHDGLKRVMYSVLKGAGIGVALGILGVLAARTGSESFSFASLLPPTALATRSIVLITLLSPTPLSACSVALSCILGIAIQVTKEDFRIGDSAKCIGWKLETMGEIPENPLQEEKLALAKEYLYNRYFLREKILAMETPAERQLPEITRLISRIETIWSKCEAEIRANASNSEVDEYQFKQHNILYRATATIANAYDGKLLKVLILVPLTYYICYRLDF